MALLAAGALLFAGCAELDAGSDAGGANSAPLLPKTETPAPVAIPPNARVIAHSVNRGENPSADFEPVTLKAPLPALYLRIRTEPPAHISVAGSVLCQNTDLTSTASVQPDLALTEADGELVARIPRPRGARYGWDCMPIFSGQAQTDPGNITLVTAELLAGS